MSGELIKSKQLTAEQKDLIKRTVARGTTDDELVLFLYVCERTGLDPFMRQIHAVKRWDSSLGREVMAIQTGIDGYRSMAEESGLYNGQDGPYWCGDDGVWMDVWLSDDPPKAAKVGIYRKGFDKAVYRTVTWKEYVQTKKDGTITQFWRRFGPTMLAKCAESQAFRAAIPSRFSGVYTHEEMSSAGNPTNTSESSLYESENLDESMEIASTIKLDENEQPPPPPIEEFDENYPQYDTDSEFAGGPQTASRVPTPIGTTPTQQQAAPDARQATGKVISTPQSRRLYAIACARCQTLGIHTENAKAIIDNILRQYGYSRSTEVHQIDYDEIVGRVSVAPAPEN